MPASPHRSQSPGSMPNPSMSTGHLPQSSASGRRRLPTASRSGASRRSAASRPALLALLGLSGALAGCNNLVLLSPHGDIAAQQGKLIMTSVWWMLLIIIPVIFLTLFFAWKYRESNKEARFEPNWDHSIQLELIIWAAPLAIIIALGAITWLNTHTLDPYRPLSRISEGENLPANDPNLLRVQVVALDWKWLFIYPDEGIAVVNDLAAPVDRQIRFDLTSASMMNSFQIPALAGQIYAMPGMETKLHAVINSQGSWPGFSANISGEGFSWMRFQFHGLDEGGYRAWIARAKASDKVLDRAEYLELAKPSQREPIRYYGKVDPELFDLVLNRCVAEGTRCMRELMVIDSHGGLGPTGIARRDQLIARGELLDVDGICRTPGVASWLLQPRTEAISSSSKAL